MDSPRRKNRWFSDVSIPQTRRKVKQNKSTATAVLLFAIYPYDTPTPTRGVGNRHLKTNFQIKGCTKGTARRKEA